MSMRSNHSLLRTLFSTGLAVALWIPACGGNSEQGAHGTLAGGAAGATAGGGKSSSGSGGQAGSRSGSGGEAGATMGGEGGMGTVEPPAHCDSDVDCQPAGMLCDPLPGVCVACLFDSDCKDGERCQDQSCKKVVSCQNSLDCPRSGSDTVCDPTLDECVECAADTDCPTSSDCIDQRCVPFTQCKNSLDCKSGKVCDTGAQRCVDCVRDADCGSSKRCVDNECRVACASDKTCTSMGMLCDLTGGFCAECLSNADCPDVYHCGSGRCLPDVCRAGSAACQGNSLATCRTAGDGYDTLACPSRTTCVEDGTDASCADWVCTAGTTECDSTASRLVTCSDDGLSETMVEDCTQQGELCVAGKCQDLACVPSSEYCDGESIRLCSSDGLSSSLVLTCSSGQFCDDASVTCKSQVCTPDQPFCNGQLAQVCNSRGSGSTGSGTDCSATSGSQCLSGDCVCQSNHADCDGSSSTGCEVNLSTDPDHCGDCDNACSKNHVPTPSCSAGNCNGTCSSGYDDCNADKLSDGCETHTDSDAQHCGSCSTPCSSNNVPTPSCSGGSCNGACASGYADCNSNKQSDGCETNTQTNPDACGGCSKSCSSTHMQTRTCSGGSCDGTCATGFDDCNDDKLSDGCETDILSDPQNCNGCGKTCAQGLSCVNGTCSSGTYHWKLVTDQACNAWCGGAPAPFDSCGGPWTCDATHVNGYLWIYSDGPNPPPNPASSRGYGWVHWYCDPNGCGGPGPNAGSCSTDNGNYIWQCVYE